MNLAESIAAAYAADRAFEAAVKAAGFKSRWDVPMHGKPAALRAAYETKVTADAVVGRAFEESGWRPCPPQVAR